MTNVTSEELGLDGEEQTFGIGIQALPRDEVCEALGSDEGCQDPGSVRNADNHYETHTCEGKRLQALSVSLTEHNDEIMNRLPSRSDREARQLLTTLNEDLKKQNEALTAFMTQLVNQNRSLQEILKRSEDGQAAISMQKAVELLVKGLANAEEEVEGLKATLEEVTSQSNMYKDQLANINAGLTSSSAHAQIARMLPAQSEGSPAVSASQRSSATTSGRSLGRQKRSSVRMNSPMPSVPSQGAGGASSFLASSTSGSSVAIIPGMHTLEDSARSSSRFRGGSNASGAADPGQGAGGGSHAVRGERGSSGGAGRASLMTQDEEIQGFSEQKGEGAGGGDSDGGDSDGGDSDGGDSDGGDSDADAEYDSEEAPSMFF